MKEKIVSALFVTSFILAGCSMDSFLDGGAPFTLICIGMVAICGCVLFV